MYVSISNFINVRDFLVLTFSLSLLIAGALFLFEGANKWILWKYDDTEHLNLAYNLFHGKGLTREFIDLEANTIKKNIPALEKYDQISSHLATKNPLYYVPLGIWLYITNANYETWNFYGSLFNLALTSFCVIVFYFLIKRYFGIWIAAFATPVLATMPALIWFSVRSRVDILLFLFVLLSLYFAAKKPNIQNVITTGIFVSLAHLSHPTGNIIGLAILAYYLLKKKFKYSLIFMSTWLLILTPWLVRNYISFGDAIRGFGIPLPRNVLTTLGLVSPDAPRLNRNVEPFDPISIIDTLKGMINEFSNVYGMDYFLIFISFSIFAFVCFSSLKKGLESTKNKVFFIIWIITYLFALTYMLLFKSDGKDLGFQILILFLIPLVSILYIKLFTQHKTVFTLNNNNIYLILVIFVLLNFLVYFLYSHHYGRVTPETRILFQCLYMLIPLSILGIKKLLEVLFSFTAQKHRKKIIMISMSIILILYSSEQYFSGIETIQEKRHEPYYEKDYAHTMNNWIKENIPRDSKIASDMPHIVLLKTGLPSVNFQHWYKDNIDYEKWIIKKFDIDYLVFYYHPHAKEDLSHLDLESFVLEKIYDGKEDDGKERGLVYSIREK
jgi:hypothetical protein